MSLSTTSVVPAQLSAPRATSKLSSKSSWLRQPSANCGLLHHLRLLLKSETTSTLESTRNVLDRAVAASSRQCDDATLVMLSLEVTAALPALHASSARLSSSRDCCGELAVNDRLVHTTNGLYAKTLVALACRGIAPQHAMAHRITSKLLRMAAAGDGRFFWHHFVGSTDQLLSKTYFNWLASGSSSSRWLHGCAVTQQAVQLSPAAGIALAGEVAPHIPCPVSRLAWQKWVHSQAERLSASHFHKSFGFSAPVDSLRVAAAARRSGGHWLEVLRMLHLASAGSSLEAVGVLRRLHNGHGNKWRMALMPLLIDSHHCSTSAEKGPELGLRVDSEGKWTAAWEQALVLCPRAMIAESKFAVMRSHKPRRWLTLLAQQAGNGSQDICGDEALRAAVALSMSMLTSQEDLRSAEFQHALLLLCEAASAAITGGSHTSPRIGSHTSTSPRPQLVRSSLCEMLVKVIIATNAATSSKSNTTLSCAVLRLVDALCLSSRDTPMHFSRVATAAMPLFSEAEKSFLFASTCSALNGARHFSPQLQHADHCDAALNRQHVLLQLTCPPSEAGCLAVGLSACLEVLKRVEDELLHSASPTEHRTLGSRHGGASWLRTREQPLPWLQLAANVVLAWKKFHGDMESVGSLRSAKSVLFLLLKQETTLSLSMMERAASATALLLEKPATLNRAEARGVGDLELLEGLSDHAGQHSGPKAADLHLALIRCCVAYSQGGRSSWAIAIKSLAVAISSNNTRQICRCANDVLSILDGSESIPHDRKLLAQQSIAAYLSPEHVIRMRRTDPQSLPIEAQPLRRGGGCKKDCEPIPSSESSLVGEHDHLLATQFLEVHVAATSRLNPQHSHRRMPTRGGDRSNGGGD